MSLLVPFQPAPASGQELTLAAGSNALVFAKGCRQVCFTNTDSAAVYVRFGTTAATAADYKVAPGQQVILSKDMEEAAGTVFKVAIGTAGAFHQISGNGN